VTDGVVSRSGMCSFRKPSRRILAKRSQKWNTTIVERVHGLVSGVRNKCGTWLERFPFRGGIEERDKLFALDQITLGNIMCA
jgi:hypothetical protein